MTLEQISKRADAAGAGGARAKPSPRRRGAGRPKGAAETRARLIEAAGRLFAEAGYSATSTRRLCRAAGVNLSAIGYHFGGKRQLYEAVIEHVIVEAAGGREHLIALIERGLIEADGNRDGLADLVAQVVNAILRTMIELAEPVWRMQLMGRILTHRASGFERLMAGHINPIHDAIADIVAAATGRADAAEETLLLTEAIVAQCLSMVFARAVILERLGWAGYDEAHVARIVATITPATQTMLGLPLRPAPGGAG